MTTVSNVLHGKAKKVSPEVEERIKKAFGQIQLYPQIRAECSDQQGL
ncbi:LacI family DNA-binding transcriptional regulator [Enterocloster clostridioformis]|nr:LacI family DNA-binding transcriptional regulator [Enterocloster clostridioformis]